MSVLVYTESWGGSFRKSTYEAVSYASETAKLLGLDVIAISSGDENDDELRKLGNYGATKILTAAKIEKGNSQAITNLIATHASESTIIIFANTYTSKMIAPRLSAKLKAGFASNVIALPSKNGSIQVQRKAFSNKALEYMKIDTEKTIITLSQNAFGLVECQKDCTIEKVEGNA